MFWVHKRMFLLCAQNIYLIGKNPDNNNFWGLYMFMSTPPKFKLLIIRNKTYRPEDFEFTRFDCKRKCSCAVMVWTSGTVYILQI